MFGSNKRTAIIAVALGISLTVAGCSSSGGKQSTSGSGISAGTASTAKIKIALITHAPAGDTFWDIVQKGAKAAAAKDNIDLVYSSDPSANNQATLVQNAIDQKVDGIALTAASPDALKSVVAKATAAGIPVVGLNAGIDQWKSLGMLEYFGQDETIAGQAFGERLNSLGAKHDLCVIQAQGVISLEARCAGIKSTFKGTTDILYVTGTDMPSVTSAITAKLQQDTSIDYVSTLGAPFALTAAQSVKAAGSSAKVATFDTNKALVAAIKDGSVQFAVDQQPYLQGYLAVDALWLYKFNGNYSGGGQQSVLTGPAFVTKDNIDTVAKFAENGTR